MNGKGKEIRKDFAGLPSILLCSGDTISGMLERAARAAGATVVSTAWKNLGDNGTPPGCTCALLLDESHITAHSYAREGLLAVNVFTCGDRAMPEVAMDFVENELKYYGAAAFKVVFSDESERFMVEDAA